MNKRNYWASLFIVVMIFCFMPVNILAGYTFSLPEQALAGPGQDLINQWCVRIDFDTSNRLHAVWVDEGPPVFFRGTVIDNTGSILAPFDAYNNTTSYQYDAPFIKRSMQDTTKMLTFGLEFTGSLLNGALSSWDLNDLPSEPGVVNLTTTPLLPPSFLTEEQIDILAVGDYLIYVYENSPDLLLRRYNLSTGAWDPSEELIQALPNTIFHYPNLAVDDDNFIYLSYDSYNTSTGRTNLIARRSATAMLIDDFYQEVYILFSDIGSFNAAFAVAGSSSLPYCAFLYADPNASSLEFVCNMDQKFDWSQDIWGGIPYTISMHSYGPFLGPNAAFAADGETLYVTWADDSPGTYEIFASVSHDGGASFDNEEQLTNNGVSILGAPEIATGTEPGNVAIAYIKNMGDAHSPFALVSMPTFFDTCGSNPAGYWDSYAGVTVVTGPVIPYSQPACYMMATAKGQLVSDYGSIEQFGGVDLYFHDDTSINNTNFLVSLENGNAKGVIRMLGVRNETTQSNYSYFGPLGWEDLGVPRTTGWHHIIINANETDGLTASLEYTPGVSVSRTDPLFETFTSVIIEGGTASDPYYIDDVTIHAFPLATEPQPIPASSTLFLGLLLAAVGIFLIRRR